MAEIEENKEEKNVTLREVKNKQKVMQDIDDCALASRIIKGAKRVDWKEYVPLGPQFSPPHFDVFTQLDASVQEKLVVLLKEDPDLEHSAARLLEVIKGQGKPPAIEVIFVEPFTVFKIAGTNFGIPFNPYGQ